MSISNNLKNCYDVPNFESTDGTAQSSAFTVPTHQPGFDSRQSWILLRFLCCSVYSTPYFTAMLTEWTVHKALLDDRSYLVQDWQSSTSRKLRVLCLLMFLGETNSIVDDKRDPVMNNLKTRSDDMTTQV